MLRFRQTSAAASLPGPPKIDAVRPLVTDLLRSCHFFLGKAGASLRVESARERIPWEIFRGRLLDPTQTREERSFESWKVLVHDDPGQPVEPRLAVHLDPVAGEIHVVRAILSRVWEGYHSGGNVYESREAVRWVRELVGTVVLAEFPGLDDVRDELMGLLFQAVVGTSRLPLTSMEAPLPAFTLGEFTYCYRDAPDGSAEPMRTTADLLEPEVRRELGELELVKLTEAVVRSCPPSLVPDLAKRFLNHWTSQEQGELEALFRRLFNEVALSPYTDFPDKTFAFWRSLVERDARWAEKYTDFLGYLLRQLGRHLTAYDLVTFHHQGANYPDALLLDAALREYVGLAEHFPQFFLADGDSDERAKKKRLRRRALRQGWMLWRIYEGHAVPDAPTSPGENARILPAPFPRVPEEQIQNFHRRRKHLFQGQPLPDPPEPVFRQSVLDLLHPPELMELGTAVFLDRPLGSLKAPGEPDQTPMLAYEAFSSSIAEKRVELLAERWKAFPDPVLPDQLRRGLRQDLGRVGLGFDFASWPQRPGVVSLRDMARVAPDFVLRRTLPGSAQEFLDLFNFIPLWERSSLKHLAPGARFLLVGGPEGPTRRQIFLTVYDAEFRRRVELAVGDAGRTRRRAGVEFPVQGLRVLRLWEEAGGSLQEADLTGEGVWLRPQVAGELV
jgi:hypothetical protein